MLHKAATIGGGKPEETQIELNRDILAKLVCPQCKMEESVYQSLGQVKADRAICPACKTVRREVVTFNMIRPADPFLDRPLAEIGVPAFDIVTVRTPTKSIGIEFTGDSEKLLGPLTESGLDWT